MVYDLFLLLFTYSPHSAKIPYYSPAVFTKTLTDITYTKKKLKIFLKFKICLGAAQKHSECRMLPVGRGLKTPDVGQTS
jgi:hypothetical protein